MPERIPAVEVTKESLYQPRKSIYAEVIRGKSHIYRGLAGFLLYGGFFLLPWLNYGDRPAIFFDITQRQFHLFSLSFWPQDFIYLAGLLILAALSLFFITTILGRIWCGFACPQTIWTMAFIWIEQKIEGKSHARKRLDDAPWSISKARKKIAKHSAWLLISVATGLTFVSYFYPIRQMLPDIIHAEIGMTGLFWIGLFSYLTYIDAGWLREQVCIYMCPYARFQSAMYDNDTLLVSYNEELAEPRASVKSADENSGACIDCKMCISVCPTGIDIREGQQMACINCSLCVDACDDIMQSLNRPVKLISFTTLNQLKGHLPLRLLRPKTLAYSAVLVLLMLIFASSLWLRPQTEISVVRDRDNIYREIENAAANDYQLKIANKSQQARDYQLSLKPAGFTFAEKPSLHLEVGEHAELDITVLANISSASVKPSAAVTFIISSNESQTEYQSIFVFPPPKDSSEEQR